MAAIERFLNEDGTARLLELLLPYIDTQIETADIPIVTTLNDEATNTTVPGTLAVYNFVRGLVANAITGTFIVIPDGTALPATPSTANQNKIHLWREETTDHWGVYVFYGGSWKFLTDFDLRLEDYWAKDELVPLTPAQVTTIFNEALAAHNA